MGMSRRIAAVTFLVRDYDEALAWFTRCLGFVVEQDLPMGPGKRWVVVGPVSNSGTSLLLARAVGEEQVAQVGRQAGGRVFLFLHTDDFARNRSHMLSQGVLFHEEPRHEAYGTVAVFSDLYGNRWDLIQPA
jgi:catechol 2,3-dioxygenase-like lactoylglutathione lyase family enzyme